MRREFNLQRWLEDRSKKVVTLNGYPVEILKWDAKGTRPIIGIYRFSENEDMEKSWTIEGKESTNPNMTSGFDLFFEEEPEMTPFEKELMIDMDYYVHNLYSLGKTEEERIEWIKAWKPRLLEFASKELDTSVESDSSDFYTELAKAFDDAQHHTASDGYVFAKKYKEKFLELARKELEPEFEAELDKAYKCADKVQYENGKKDAMKNIPIWKREQPNEKYIHNKGWYLTWAELEKLPKEECDEKPSEEIKETIFKIANIVYEISRINSNRNIQPNFSMNQVFDCYDAFEESNEKGMEYYKKLEKYVKENGGPECKGLMYSPEI